MMEQPKVEHGERLRPYSCNQCQKSFKYRYELRRHLKRRDHQKPPFIEEKRDKIVENLHKDEEFSREVETLEVQIKKNFAKLNEIRQKQRQIGQLKKDIKDLVANV